MTTSAIDDKPLSVTDSAEPKSVTAVELDLETQSRCDLNECGNWRYSEDPSTNVLCMVYRIDGNVHEHRFSEAEATSRKYLMPARLLAVVMRTQFVVAAHNVQFEQSIWRNVLGWPEPAGGWRCSMAIVAAQSLPMGLDDVSRVRGHGEKDKLGYRLMLKYCKPDKKGVLAWPTTSDMEAIVSYCGRDVELESKHVADFGLDMQPGQVEEWKQCNAMNERGIYFDAALAADGVFIRDTMTTEVRAAVEVATKGAVKSNDLTRVAFLKQWLGSRGFEVDSLSANVVARMVEDPAMPDDVRAVLNGRAALSKSSVAKLDTMLAARALDGRIKGCFAWHGAATGRAAGRMFQPQNPPKPAKWMKQADVEACIAAVQTRDLAAVTAAGRGDPEETLKAIIRPTICAAPGNVLVLCDYAAVECRGALWLAEDEEHLDWFRKGIDAYCVMASRIYGQDINKKDHPNERQIGKTAVLGCGYGMGVDRFENKCKEDGLDLAAAGTTAQECIDAYRREFTSLAAKRRVSQGIPGGLWARLGAAAVYTVESGLPASVGYVTFRMDAMGRLRMDLPSGRSLTYWHPRVIEEEVEWITPEGDVKHFMAKNVYFCDYTSKDKRTKKHGVTVKAWGGHWLENANQAICHHLTCGAMLRCEAAGLPVIIDGHDEIVLEVPESQGEAALRFLEHTMTAGEPWADGFPIAVEGKITRRYFK